MKKIYLLLVVMSLSLFTKAEIVVVDGICYDVISKTKTAEVLPLSRTGETFFDEELNAHYTYYTGNIVIPATIEYNNEIYYVTSIGADAFVAIDIPDVGNPRRGTNSLLKSVTIPNGVTSIGVQAFYQCSGLKTVNIPDGVNYIGDSAFSGCSSLTSITLPNGITEIPGGLFTGCTNLSSVNVPSSVEVIGSNAFGNLKKLTIVNLPEGLKRIEAYAFSGSGLNSIYIPNSVNVIQQDAFRNCYNLASVHLPDSLKEIGTAAFWYDKALTTVVIPDSVKVIGSLAFRECDKLKTIFIGSGVTTIWDSFSYCRELMDVYCYADKVPQTYSKAFENSMIEYATLHVPAGSIEAYRATEPWSGFGTIKTLSGETPETPKCATPNIIFVDGKLEFNCDTEGVEYVCRVTPPSAFDISESGTSLPTIYKVTVYATKEGYENSNTATMDIDVSSISSGIRGDVNFDNEIGMPDVMFIVNYILNGKFPDE